MDRLACPAGLEPATLGLELLTHAISAEFVPKRDSSGNPPEQAVETSQPLATRDTPLHTTWVTR